ncbi:MAG: DUF839 domain-containing protein [Oscillatoriales cyanobacterium RM2_1_1]|nr:DUF839 domain-containing protein [Oscillatoriales cyanobacterium SM2_3_0]NJO46118.1 DUF839 domain-containing protein [Oscillatoriales cyanobacterium RM2_1_1]
MGLRRREFLLFLGASLGTATIASCRKQVDTNLPSVPQTPGSSAQTPISFKPIKGPLPLETDAIENQVGQLIQVSTASAEEQTQAYQTYEVIDDIVLPEGFTYEIVATWGDPVGNSRFGFNNDYLSFVPTKENEGFLTVNFEYISPIPWLQGFKAATGKSLPMDKLENALKSTKDAKIDAFSLKADDPTRQLVREVSQEGLTDLGMGVISVRRTPEGKWERTYSKADRRVTGLSGWTDNRYLKSTGPGASIFRKPGQGYDDRLGDRIIGTFGNCAGGTTPWGTVFSGEENVQMYIADAVYPDGSSFPPSKKPFSGAIEGLGNVFGLAGNKYGWMVELDPANPEDYGTKHTWLGRYRHEAVGIRAEAGKPVAFYSGCDRRGGHLYKFVSAQKVVDPQAKTNSQLLNDGMLYVAKFNPDGSGVWIPLKADTAVNPDAPEVHAGGMIALPKRPEGGDFMAATAEDITSFKQKFKTLGDLYQGNTPEEVQGAILIDAHLAGSAVGGTCTARPEDTDVGPTGALFITFTSGFPEEEAGGPDLRVFKGQDGEMSEFGWIVRIDEANNDPGATTFRWDMFATGGEVADGGLGFSNPDNLLFDRNGNLWMVTDISTTKLNKSVPQGRMNKKTNQPMEQPDTLGIFGNNSLWFFPTSGENAGEGYLFALGPMESEMTGPYFTEDQQTLFIAVQHPGETKGTRQDMKTETRGFSVKTTKGQEFMQTRQVPVGSNWPTLRQNDPPKPSVVAIRRINSGQIV